MRRRGSELEQLLLPAAAACRGLMVCDPSEGDAAGAPTMEQPRTWVQLARIGREAEYTRERRIGSAST